MTSTGEIPHREDWKEHYPTQTAYGQTYPTPEDWTFGDFERGGMFLSWRRFEGIGREHTDNRGVIEARDSSKDAGSSDETAMLSPESEFEYVETESGPERHAVADPADRKLTIGGETVLEVYQPFEEDELLAAVAAILTRHSNGEDYDEIVRAMELVDPETDQTLDEWL